MPGIELDDLDRRRLAGDEGRAAQLAMRLLVAAADASGASGFVPIEFAHINSCHWSGRLSVDFAEFLLAEGAELAVPTHTNASLIDVHRPGLRSEAATPDAVAGATRLMEIYEALGCTTMWSCAPYHEPRTRPTVGTHIVGSESNAVSFFNSVLGARTNKYGDLLDVSAAIIGKVPLTGLHTDVGRRARHEIRVELDDVRLSDPTLPHLLGVIAGRAVGAAVPVFTGVAEASEDDLKAIAAAGATAGAIEMFHVVAITPEAPTLEDATGGRPVDRVTVVDVAALDEAAALLTTTDARRIDSVCLGTPHFSIDEFSGLRSALAGRPVHDDVDLVVTTSRAVAHELALRGWNDELDDLGVQIVLDTCTYYPPQPTGVRGVVMTNSAKWAYYAPGMLPVDVVFGGLHACAEAAVSGRVGSGS
ncbi:MAG: aconitase X [Actinomycetota bacterium]